MAGVGRTRACAYPGALYPQRCPQQPGRTPFAPARMRLGAGRALLLECPASTAADDRCCVCAAWSDRVVSVVAPSWRQVFENSIAWGSSTASGRSVDRSRFYKNIEPSWCRGPARGIAF
jgi:hypothetical protein